MNDKHYEIELPLKKLKQQLPHNKTLALQRASSLKRKLLRDNKVLKDYQVYLSDLIANGYAKLATEDGTIGKTWCILHHGIYHPDKPGKLRIVDWNLESCAYNCRLFNFNLNLLTAN